MPGDTGPCREGCPVCALQGRTSAPTPFDAALAALDVEPTHHPDRMVTTYDILGLDAVRAAHGAEVERAVAEEREAIVAYVREACGEGTLLTAQACAALRVTASAIEGGCRALNNQRAAIRARGAKS